MSKLRLPRTQLVALLPLFLALLLTPMLCAEDFLKKIEELGVSPARIIGLDDSGVPRVCGTGVVEAPSSSKRRSKGLQLETRSYETIPGVIRDDGVESFRVEVHVNGSVSRVVMRNLGSPGLVPPEDPPFDLEDDGTGEDRVAGDGIYTTGLYRWNTAVPLSPSYKNDPTSPSGLDIVNVGAMLIEETDGKKTQFLLNTPQVGVLSSTIEAVSVRALSSSVVASPHLVNILGNNRETQRTLREIGGDVRELTRSLYELLPDAFDFVVFFSIDHVERTPYLSEVNLRSGVHFKVQVNYTGMGLNPFDGGAIYGSSGRLLSVNILDTHERGIVGENVTHEIVHQWEAYISTSLGLSDSTQHYLIRASVGSLVGGLLWLENGDGTFTIDCDQGRNGATQASELGRYLMGLIPASAVSPIHIYDERSHLPHVKCTSDLPVTSDEIVRTVTIEDIQALHGERWPGPEESQKDFSILFVAESHNRLLTSTEMTFYDRLAEHYTGELSPEQPDPRLTRLNWPSVTRFLGAGTTWTSDVVLGGSQMGFDVNQDGRVDVVDPLALLFLLFGLGDETLPCGTGSFDDRSNALLFDWNEDENVDLADPVAALAWMFVGGAPHSRFGAGGLRCHVLPGCPEVCSTDD